MVPDPPSSSLQHDRSPSSSAPPATAGPSNAAAKAAALELEIFEDQKELIESSKKPIAMKERRLKALRGE